MATIDFGEWKYDIVVGLPTFDAGPTGYYPDGLFGDDIEETEPYKSILADCKASGDVMYRGHGVTSNVGGLIRLDIELKARSPEDAQRFISEALLRHAPESQYLFHVKEGKHDCPNWQLDKRFFVED